MKKLAVFLVAIMVSSMSAMASIYVTWSGTEGFLRSDDNTGIMEPAGTGLTAWLQLIYTPDNNYGLAGVGGTVEGDEVILATYQLTDAGGSDPYGNFAESFGEASTAYDSGFIYGRVFDGGTGADPANTIVVGTWYYNGPIQATAINPDPGAPDSYDIQNNNPSINFGGLGDVLNLQVVPEPATFALMGLGGLALAIRRRMRA